MPLEFVTLATKKLPVGISPSAASRFIIALNDWFIIALNDYVLQLDILIKNMAASLYHC